MVKKRYGPEAPDRWCLVGSTGTLVGLKEKPCPSLSLIGQTQRHGKRRPSQPADELLRQVTVDNAERGLLLLRVRDEVRMTTAAYTARPRCILKAVKPTPQPTQLLIM